MVENWDDTGHEIQISVVHLDAGTDSSGTVFDRYVELGPTETALYERVMDDVGQYRATARTNVNRDTNDQIFVRSNPGGSLDGRGVQIRTGAQTPVSVVSFTE